MTVPALEKEMFIEFDKEIYNDRIRTLINFTVDKFQRTLRSYTLFNLFFFLLITGEIVYFFVHSQFLACMTRQTHKKQKSKKDDKIGKEKFFLHASDLFEI